MKITFKHIFFAASLLLSAGITSSCTGDLDVNPIDPNLNTAQKIKAEQSMNKLYAYLAIPGNSGGNGSDSDVDGIDGGTSGFVRQLFNSEELTTDEAICAWGDPGIADFNFNTYNAGHPMLEGFYYRIMNAITACNQYLKDFGSYNTTMTAEARFLRALEYYYLMNAFGNVPFTETVGETPQRMERKDMYAWLINELKTNVEPNLRAPAPKKSTDPQYGAVDKAAAWILLARLYLNAEVYTGTADWANAATYAQQVISSPYQLYTTPTTTGGRIWSAYQKLFMADNGESGASVEAIFPLLQDGLKTTSYGTTFFLMAGSNDGHEKIKDAATEGNGTTGTWGGNRARPDLVRKFFPSDNAPSTGAYNMPAAANDDRAIFHSDGRTLLNGNTEDDVKKFTNGYAVCKFNNFRSDGATASSPSFPDTDFFLMRAAEAYLIYAEATARTNGGNATAQGVTYINQLRSRAHAATKPSYSLREICDEWSREFYFEGMRRTTLIRFGYFGGNNNYNWEWKGGVKNGRNFDDHYNLFAIPSKDLNENHNLHQNPGYAGA